MLGERPDSTKKSGINYEKLGKAVEDALILDYIYVLQSTRRQIWSSFFRGIFAGLGGVIGATVGAAALVGILQLFGGLPVIGKLFTQVGDTIQPTPTPVATPTPRVKFTPTPVVTTPTPITPTVTPSPTPALPPAPAP